MQAILVKPRYNMPAAGCIMRFFVSGNSEILGELMPRGFFLFFFFFPLGPNATSQSGKARKVVSRQCIFCALAVVGPALRHRGS